MKLSSLLIAVFAMPFISGNVVAADLGMVNLIMTGTIITESCSLDVPSQYQHVDLGGFPANSLTSVGDVTPTKPFTLRLNGCSNSSGNLSSISDATITFSGTPDGTDDSLLALSDFSGSGEMASGVAVQVLDKDMKAVALNTPTSVGTLNEGNNVLQYYLRYKVTSVPVKAGNASAILYFDMSYQ